MKRHIFTYGSLMFPEVWQRVVAGNYRSCVGTIADHARYAVADETYPGVIAQEGASVAGVVYFDVHAADVDILDRFEGSDYLRVTVKVSLPSGEVEADTYLYVKRESLTKQAWDPQAFEMHKFLQTYCGFPPG